MTKPSGKARQNDVPWRPLVQICGIAAAVLFVIVGVGYGLQMFADGSIFSYGVAAEDAWAFHWHNISTRVAVYLYAHVPAEAYVSLTKDARGGITLYGTLFFIAPLLGLIATRIADSSANRTFFTFACLSTATLCPLVFGFPTEMWIGHAVYWPTLALAFCGHRRLSSTLMLLTGITALMLTHETGVVFAIGIVCFLALRGFSDSLFLRGVMLSSIAITIWAAIRYFLPPDAYYAVIIPRGALTLVDVENLTHDSAAILAICLTCYGLAVFAGSYWITRRTIAVIAATLLTAIGLVIYWLWFDQSVQAVSRYPLRTVLFISLPLLGAFASLRVMLNNNEVKLLAPTIPRLLGHLHRMLELPVTAGIGALGLIILVHVVETTKFVNAWQRYTMAVRDLAMNTPPAHKATPNKLRELGDSRLVSSELIDDVTNEPAWYSTTQYLSILVSPGFLPRRLVVDPDAGYFWLSCTQAKQSETASRAIPKASRTLIRVHACLNRPE